MREEGEARGKKRKGDRTRRKRDENLNATAESRALLKYWFGAYR